MARKSAPRCQPKPSHELRRPLPRGSTPAEGSARLLVEGLASNTMVAQMFSSMLPESDITEAFAQTLSLTRRVAAGDRAELEAILAAQLLACNAIFTDCVKRARQNYQNVEVHDRLMRLGLRAQGQCRATAESIAVMQSPPTVFAKQANIANGPQQVNNGVPATRARSGNSPAPNKLMEAGSDVAHIDRVDARAKVSAGGGNSGVAAVAQVNRSAKLRR